MAERGESGLLTRWLERLTGNKKVMCSIPIWGSEIFQSKDIAQRSFT